MTPRQDKAIVGLLSEPTIQEAAKKAGVAEITLHRWLRNDAFARAYRQARRQAVQQSIAALQQGSSDAVKVLRDVMNDVTVRDSTRVAAAREVLGFALKATEIEDILERLEALEQRLEGAK